MSVLFAPSVCQIGVDFTHVCIVRTIGLPNWCGFYSCLYCLHHPCIKLVWILLMSVLFAPSVYQISVDFTHVCIVRTIGLPNWCGFYSCLYCLHHPCIKLVWILLMSVLFAPSVYQINVDLTHVCIVCTIRVSN